MSKAKWKGILNVGSVAKEFERWHTESGNVNWLSTSYEKQGSGFNLKHPRSVSVTKASENSLILSTKVEYGLTMK